VRHIDPEALKKQVYRGNQEWSTLVDEATKIKPKAERQFALNVLDRMIEQVEEVHHGMEPEYTEEFGAQWEEVLLDTARYIVYGAQNDTTYAEYSGR